MTPPFLELLQFLNVVPSDLNFASKSLIGDVDFKVELKVSIMF